VGSRGKLFVVSGPSGAGKGTLVAGVLARVPGLSLSISATTRAARPGEVDGREYHFLSQDAFVRRREAGEFLEWAEVHGNLYGTLRPMVERELAAGSSVILEIDVQGAYQVKAKVPEAVLVFVLPPTMEELERRLSGRGTEDEGQVRGRLKTALEEMKEVHHYDHAIVNDQVERATRDLAEIIASETAG